MLPSDIVRLSNENGPGLRLMVFGPLVLSISLAFSGCVAVPVYRQEMVSGPGMLFSNSPVLASEPALLTQVEPGLASNGGGQAAGCTSCR